jgi:hypothetical protein
MGTAEESLPRKMWNDTVGGAESGFFLVKRMLTVKAGTVLVTGGVLGYIWWTRRPSAVANDVLRTFESGGQLGWSLGFKEDLEAGIKRPIVENTLEQLFFGKGRAAYILIVGEHGTGKSTIVRRVIRERKGVNGAIYVNVPTNLTKFGDVVSEAVAYSADFVELVAGVRRRINATTKEEREPLPSEEPMATWNSVSDSIKAASIKFHEKHGRPAVLIFDSSERIAKASPAFLAELQEFAKDMTDSGILRVVFVSSDGSVLAQLRGRSAWSRALKPPFEVGDISDADAVEFLKGKGVEEEQATEAVRDITGGRFALLTDYLSAYKSVGNKVALREFWNSIEEQLSERVKLPPDHAFFRKMVEQGCVDSATARSLVSEETRKALLSGNIVAAHYARTQALTFHSRYVETFFKRVFAESDEG